MKAEAPLQKSGTALPVDPPSHAELLRESCAALLSTGQCVRFRATGLSMEPTIRDGDLLTVEPADPGAVRRGEILLYRAAQGVIAHRLVRCEPAGGQPRLVLRGDAAGTCDPPVGDGEVLGRVVAVQRRGRSWGLTSPCTVRWQRVRAAATRVVRAALRRLRPRKNKLIS